MPIEQGDQPWQGGGGETVDLGGRQRAQWMSDGENCQMCSAEFGGDAGCQGGERLGGNDDRVRPTLG